MYITDDFFNDFLRLSNIEGTRFEQDRRNHPASSYDLLNEACFVDVSIDCLNVFLVRAFSYELILFTSLMLLRYDYIFRFISNNPFTVFYNIVHRYNERDAIGVSKELLETILDSSIGIRSRYTLK